MLENQEIRDETKRMMKLFNKLAKFYDPPEKDKNLSLWEITSELLKSSLVEDSQKQAIKESQRKFFVFVYPSDGLRVKGVVSFVPNPHIHPTVVLLRGGNRIFGIPHPASEFFCTGNNTFISTLYRGGVSEGIDEYGGDDVNDVKNLMEFLPELENQLSVRFDQSRRYLIGFSRGGMQLFLALTRFPKLQNMFKKAVALSGMLDLRHCLKTRTDMKEMFTDDFGLQEEVNGEEWVNYRDPLLTADKISPALPLLIIQGTEDIRVPLIEGLKMKDKLLENGCDVTYWEIEGGTHCLSNKKGRMAMILEWAEKGSSVKTDNLN